MKCPACAADLGLAAVGWAFCPKCGGAMVPMRSTGQMRAASEDTETLLHMVEERFEDLRRHPGAPDELLTEGQRLIEIVRRRDVLAKDVWRTEFDALLRWVRSVGEFRTK